MAKKAKNNKALPLIMLPVSMFLAGIVKLVICNIPEHIQLTFGMEAFGEDYDLYYFLVYTFLFIGKVTGLAIIIASSLFCKGLNKKLLFVASACAGTIAYIFIPGRYYLQNIIYYAFPDWGYSVADIIAIVLNSLIIIGCFILSIVIGTLLFKSLSGYEAAPIEEGKKAFNLKKMLLPCGFIIGVVVIEKIASSILGAMMPNISNEGTDSLVSVMWWIAIPLIQVAFLLGSLFFTKDKYKTLTCLGAASIGYHIANCGLTSVIAEIISTSISKTGAETAGTAVYEVLGVMTYAGTVIFGIVAYILLNRKEMKKIED